MRSVKLSPVGKLLDQAQHEWSKQQKLIARNEQQKKKKMEKK